MNEPVPGGVEDRVDVLGGPIDDRGADMVHVQPAIEGRAAEVPAGCFLIHDSSERKGVRGRTGKGPGIVGQTYLERGHPVVVLCRWGGRGPRNVLILRADGTKVVRPFRGLRAATSEPKPRRRTNASPGRAPKPAS